MQSRHKVASDRAELAVEIVGSGDPVVFLHAGVCDSRMWQHQMAQLGKNRKAVAYDRRGFGATRAEMEPHSAVADLKAVLAATAQGASAVLVGCSQGGRIAIDAALLVPSSIRALVLIAPTIAGSPEPAYSPSIATLLADLRQAEAARDIDRINAIKARLWLDGPLAQEGRVAGAARDLFLDMNGIALRAGPIGTSLDTGSAFDRLGEIAVPVLSLWGDLDFPHIQERSRAIVPKMANATGRALAGTAHLPSLERPAEVTELIAAFLEELD